MRFRRHERHPFVDTARKRSAFARRLRLERESLPLFSDQIASEQPEVNQVMQERADAWARNEQASRDYRALKWREARRRLAAYPQPTRGALRAYWQRCRWPADPVYLLSMIHMHETSRLVV